MATRFLPRNPSKVDVGSQPRSFTARKTSSSSQKLPVSRDERPIPIGCEPRTQSTRIINDYEQKLQGRLPTAQQVQISWYNGVASEVSRQNALCSEHFQAGRRELADRVAVARKQHEQARRTQADAHRAGLLDRAKQRRLTEEDHDHNLRKAAEEQMRYRQERLEQWRIQREEAEAEAARQAQFATKEEKQRRLAAEAADRVRRNRLGECTVCLEEGDLAEMVELECGHWYCKAHLREAFNVGWSSKKPFQCCRQVAPTQLVMGLLPPAFCVQYELWLLERATPNPVFCANRKCGVFIPPVMAEGPHESICLGCGQSTCRHCRFPLHPGIRCSADIDTHMARKLAAKKGWKECPSCHRLIEKRDGCMYMTCLCGTGFCYRCGKFYTICAGQCSS